MRGQMHCVFLDRQSPPHALLTQQSDDVVGSQIVRNIYLGTGYA
jgi:hypothetical protein